MESPSETTTLIRLPDLHGSAQELMQADLDLFGAFSSPVVRFHKFLRPSLTFGVFSSLDRFCNPEILHEEGIDSAQRPTGGGVTLHFGDISFAFYVPKQWIPDFTSSIASYEWIHQNMLEALTPLLKSVLTLQDHSKHSLPSPSHEGDTRNFCSLSKTRYDLVWQEKKLMGAAQRKRQEGLLHQGTLFWSTPCRNRLIKLFPSYADGFYQTSNYLQSALPSKSIEEMQELLTNALRKCLHRNRGT